MKIDRRRPKHWLLLAGFGLQAALGFALRVLVRSRTGTVVLYGHKLNGNLLALCNYMLTHPECGLRPVFLSMDREYLLELREQGIGCCWASGPGCAMALARADALVSDHGLHSLGPWRGLYQKLGLLFFDVWHGMSTMDYSPRDTSARHGYDEIWVASDLYREIYASRFGFDRNKVVVTGHARTDPLLNGVDDRTAIRAKYGLPDSCTLILFAPTWRQQAKHRSLYPFGCGEADFLAGLTEVATRHGASVVMRTHLNSGDIGIAGTQGIYMLPASRHPDTEAILKACDILVCDWSTIAFDWLLLDRPALFLDVEPPYPLGDFLGSEFRFGEIVSSFPALLQSLTDVLDDPGDYWREFAPRHQAAKDKFYGDMADGRATERCMERLLINLRD